MAKKVPLTHMPPPEDAPRPIRRMPPERPAPSVVAYPGPPPQYTGPPRTDRPKWAGIMLIVAGLVLIGNTGYMMTLGSGALDDTMNSLLDQQGGDMNESERQETKDLVKTVLQICYVGFLIMGAIIIAAGISASMRRMWGLCMLGAVLAVVSMTAFFIPTILGAIALYMLYKSKPEFVQNTGY